MQGNFTPYLLSDTEATRVALATLVEETPQ